MGFALEVLGCSRSGSSPLPSSVDYETSTQLDALFWCCDLLHLAWIGLKKKCVAFVKFVNFSRKDKIKCELRTTGKEAKNKFRSRIEL